MKIEDVDVTEWARQIAGVVKAPETLTDEDLEKVKRQLAYFAGEVSMDLMLKLMYLSQEFEDALIKDYTDEQ